MRWLAVLAAAGCAEDVGPEQACEEVGIAIGARAEECTGDVELAVALVEAFQAEAECVAPAPGSATEEVDLYACALVLRNLACELSAEYGADLSRWLETSSCPAVARLR